MKKKLFTVFSLCIFSLLFFLNFQVFAEEKLPLTPPVTQEEGFTLKTSVSPKEGGSIAVKVDGKDHNGEKIKKGATVTLSVSEAEAYLFDRWEISSTVESLPESSLTKKEITFLMPEMNLDFKAVLKENKTKYTVYIEANDASMGSPNFGHKDFLPGETVKVDAASSDGFRFVRWVDSDNVLKDLEKDWDTKSVFSFKMPAKDVHLTVEFDYVTYFFTLKVEGEGEVEVIGKEKNETGKYPCTVGEEILLSATPGEDFNFVNWSSTNSAEFSDYDKSDTTMTCPASDFTLTANFASAVKKLTMESSEGGTVFPEKGETAVGVDTLVNIVASPNPGYRFSHWECSSEKGDFENSKKAETNFTMPDEDCTVKAVFVKGKYQLTLKASAGGKVEGKAGAYEMGEKVPIKAIPMKGYKFSRWLCEVNGVLASEEASTEAIVPGEDVRITAVFILKTGVAPEVSGGIEKDENSFPWGILIVVFLLSAASIALVIIRDRYNLSYRLIIKQWFAKKDKK